MAIVSVFEISKIVLTALILLILLVMLMNVLYILNLVLVDLVETNLSLSLLDVNPILLISMNGLISLVIVFLLIIFSQISTLMNVMSVTDTSLIQDEFTATQKLSMYVQIPEKYLVQQVMSLHLVFEVIVI